MQSRYADVVLMSIQMVTESNIAKGEYVTWKKKFLQMT